jgi:hypothetical protein
MALGAGMLRASVRGRRRCSPRRLLAAVITACTLVGGANVARPALARSRSPRPEPMRFVVTQLPLGTAAEKAGARSGGTLRADYGEGARLVLVEGGRMLKVLSSGFASAADPDVSFDGQKILFAAKKQAGDRWAIYEMNADGSGARLVTQGPDDDRSPIALPTSFTLTADPYKGTDPWEQIGFIRVSAHDANENGDSPASSLCAFRTNKPENPLVRLGYNLSNDMDPAVLPDGRVLYASWQRATLERGRDGRIALLAVNTDGTDAAVFSADEGQRVKQMPCVTADGLVVFVEGDKIGWDGAGALASVSLRRNLHSFRRITSEKDGLFRAPAPLPDGGVLAAMRPVDASGTLAIVRVDSTSGKVSPVFDDPHYHDIQVKALAPRALPDRRSTPTKDGEPDGTLYGLNVYLNDLPPDTLPPGSIKRLRVIEGIPNVQGEDARAHGLSGFARRRLLGEAPIQADGSFQVQIPANLPVQLQILDEDGLALRTSGWISARSRYGAQGCVGCHENGELAPTNRFVDALAQPAVKLNLPPDKRRSVDFKHDIAPLVQTRCLSCHAEGKAVPLDGGNTTQGAFSRAYDVLLTALGERPRGEGMGTYAHPGRARTSPLVWHLFGRNTSRPWDGAFATRPVRAMTKDVGLTAEERQLFVEWIDLGALWDATAPTAGGE